MTLISTRILSLTLMSALLLWTSFAKADLVIQIDQSSDNAMPVAIVPFEWKGETLVPPADMGGIIGADLYRSGKFRAIPEGELPSLPPSQK